MYSLANLQANTLVKTFPTKHSNSTSLCTPNTPTVRPLSPRTTSRRAQTSNGSTRTPLSNISLEIYVPAYSETRCRNCLSVLISHWFSFPPSRVSVPASERPALIGFSAPKCERKRFYAGVMQSLLGSRAKIHGIEIADFCYLRAPHNFITDLQFFMQYGSCNFAVVGILHIACEVLRDRVRARVKFFKREIARVTSRIRMELGR
jgi:hypothetical protein